MSFEENCAKVQEMCEPSATSACGTAFAGAARGSVWGHRPAQAVRGVGGCTLPCVCFGAGPVLRCR